MIEKRYVRYLLDGGFSFGDEQVLPKWSIGDNKDKDSPFTFLEFEDEYKDLCDNIIKVLNEQHETIQIQKAINGEMEDYLARLEEENEQLKAINKYLIEILEHNGATIEIEHIKGDVK